MYLNASVPSQNISICPTCTWINVSSPTDGGHVAENLRGYCLFKYGSLETVCQYFISCLFVTVDYLDSGTGVWVIHLQVTGGTNCKCYAVVWFAIESGVWWRSVSTARWYASQWKCFTIHKLPFCMEKNGVPKNCHRITGVCMRVRTYKCLWTCARMCIGARVHDMLCRL